MMTRKMDYLARSRDDLRRLSEVTVAGPVTTTNEHYRR